MCFASFQTLCRWCSLSEGFASLNPRLLNRYRSPVLRTLYHRNVVGIMSDSTLSNLNQCVASLSGASHPTPSECSRYVFGTTSDVYRISTGNIASLSGASHPTPSECSRYVFGTTSDVYRISTGNIASLSGTSHPTPSECSRNNVRQHSVESKSMRRFAMSSLSEGIASLSGASHQHHRNVVGMSSGQRQMFTEYQPAISLRSPVLRTLHHRNVVGVSSK